MHVDFSGQPAWAWWPRHQLTLAALQSTTTNRGTAGLGGSKTRRDASSCLKVHGMAPFVKRTTPDGVYLVDHTSALGGVPASLACPGYPGYVPDFDATLAVWVGCTHSRYDDWTGYMCRHPLQHTVALKCFRFGLLPRCHLGKDMPCTPPQNDAGCKGGLMRGETCTQACPAGFRIVGGNKRTDACPIKAPVCETVCDPEKTPAPRDWLPFKVTWNSLLQEASIKAKKYGDMCLPHTLLCGQSTSIVRCGVATCPPLPWAGIHYPARRGTQHAAKCPEGYASAVPSVACSMEGTWSYTDNACRLIQAPTIRVSKKACIHNRKEVTKIVVFPGFPPVSEKYNDTWWEPCTSPPPKCCPSDTIDASDGYYDKYNVPRCRCRYAKLGFSKPSPCCGLEAIPAPPAMQFFAVYKGDFDIVTCNTTCSSASCYRHPQGCIAFNKTHMARGTPASTQNYLIQAFTWKF